MSADIVSDIFILSQQQEFITLMDDYGSTAVLIVGAAAVAQRAQMITTNQAAMAARQAQTEQMAAAVSMTLPAPMALAAKVAVFAQMKAGTYVAAQVSAPANT